MEVDMLCAVCGHELKMVEYGRDTIPKDSVPWFKIAPCKRCLDESFQKGFVEGKE
jgi:hypothetical protein